MFANLALRNVKSKSLSTTSKRTLTGRAKCIVEKCGSFFSINVDSCSFYMQIGTGIGKHSHHASHVLDSVNLPKRLIPGDVTESIQELAHCKTSTRSIVEMAKLKFDVTISKRQVADMAQFSIMAKSVHATGEISFGNMSDPDRMITYFIENDIPHIVLSYEKNINLFEFKGQSLRKSKKCT